MNNSNSSFVSRWAGVLLAVAVIGLHSVWTSAQVAASAKLRWLGHAAFVYTTSEGKVILIDPWITNPKAPKGVQFGKVDAILVTHGHSDHVGEAFVLAKKHGATFVASYELTLIAGGKGVKNTQPLNPSGSAQVAGVTVTAVQAVHSSSYQEGKSAQYAGAPLGFILSEPGQPVVYHAGDTGVFGDMELIGKTYHPDVALLPIGGVFVMKPAEAAIGSKMLGSKTIIPMHFGTFPMLAGTPAELKVALKKISSQRVRELAPGEEATLAALVE